MESSADAVRIADRMISEALARGDLDPAAGVGQPLGRLDDDPDWWIRAFLEREQLPDRFAAVSRTVAEATARAIRADDLPEARRRLAEANAHAATWNRDAPPGHRIPIRSEVWLLDRRAERPAE